MSKLRVGIVGCGAIFHYHYNFIGDYKDATLCAVADKDEKALGKVAQMDGSLAMYTNLEEMIEKEKTDVIHITTPPQTHAPLAETALILKNHVFVEKPVALDYENASKLFEVARENGVKLCVDHNHLFDPWMLRARDLLNRLNFEDIVYVESYYGINTQIPEIMGYRGANEISWIFDLPGGLFHDFMTHPLYLMLEYTGKPETIQTMSRSYGTLFQPDLSDELHIMIDGKNAMGKLTISFNAKPFQHFLKVYHKRMIITVDFNNMTMVSLPVSKLPGAATKITNNLSTAKQLTAQTVSNVSRFLSGKLKPYSGMKTLIHGFYDSIIQDKETPVSSDQALEVVEVMDNVWKHAGKIHPTFENIPGVVVEQENSKGKVLVTGAGGFLGKRLTKVLMEKGYAVRVFLRKLSRIDDFKKMGVEIHYGDVRDEETLKRAISGMDYIIHAAAAQEGDWDTFEQTTVKGTANVFKLSRLLNIKRIIYISSMSVYQVNGLRPGSMISEHSLLEQDPQARGYYTSSKVEAENAVKKLMANKDTVPTVILRPATIYGPTGPIFTPLIGLSIFDKLFVVLGKKRMELPLVYIDNLVDAILLSMESKDAVGETFNVIDDMSITKEDYLNKFMKKSFPGSVSLFLPYGFVYGTVLFQEAAFKLIRKNPVLTRYRLGSASNEVKFSNKKIKDKLNWTPNISIDEGLERTFAWYHDHLSKKKYSS